MTQVAAAPWTLIYDGDCRFCAAGVRLVHHWDTASRVRSVPFQDATALLGLPPIPRSALESAMHLVTGDGRVWAGAAAVPPLLRLLPLGGLPAALFRIPGVPVAAALVYTTIARHRHRLGCGSAVCARRR